MLWSDKCLLWMLLMLMLIFLFLLGYGVCCVRLQEVKQQSRALDGMDERMDGAHDKVVDAKNKLATATKKVCLTYASFSHTHHPIRKL
jgi:hypothetical protein